MYCGRGDWKEKVVIVFRCCFVQLYLASDSTDGGDGEEDWKCSHGESQERSDLPATRSGYIAG